MTETQEGLNNQLLENKQIYQCVISKLVTGFDKCQLSNKVGDYKLGVFLFDLINYFEKDDQSEKILTVFEEGKINEDDKSALKKGFNEAQEIFSLIAEEAKYNFINRVRYTEDLLRLAKMNQRIIAAFYRLIGSDPTQTANEGDLTLFFILAQFSVCETRYGAEDFKLLLNGVRAQAGLMDLLFRNNYRFMVPETDEEIGNIDLQGVDIIAFDPKGVILFLDAKSKSKIDDGTGQKISNSEVKVEPKEISRKDIHTLVIEALKIDRAPSSRVNITLKYNAAEVLWPTDTPAVNLLGKMIDTSMEKNAIKSLETLSAAAQRLRG